MRRLLLVVFLAATWALLGHSLPVAAYSSDGKQFINADNTFYAYVKSGETLSADFVRVAGDSAFDNIPGPVTFVIDGLGVAEQRCTAPANVAIGKGCHFAAQTASKSGIWRIQLIPPTNAKVYNEAAPNVHWGGSWFSWNITVDAGTTEQHGRLWTEQYNLRQHADARYLDNLVNFYISEDGYIYKATEFGYNGQISTLSADGIGNRLGTSCVSAYESVEVGDATASPAYGTCGSSYKMFFEQPAGDLPTSAMQWDGKTTDWIRPNVNHPSISDLKFKSDGSNDQLSGTISFVLHNFVGQYQIKIDVDNNGGFDDQNDVVLNEQVKKLANGQQQIHFQGVDKQGQIISPSATIGIQVAITKVAEIHLTAADVEGRTGGLELVRLNGDNAPTTRLCWNDTGLALTTRTNTTPTSDGRDCPDSTGGLHSWGYDDNSWGNARYIDDWVYASAKLDGTNQIKYPDVTVVATKTTRNPLALVVAITAFALLIIIILIVVIRARRHRMQKPPQLPPPTDFGTPRY